MASAAASIASSAASSTATASTPAPAAPKEMLVGKGGLAVTRIDGRGLPLWSVGTLLPQSIRTYLGDLSLNSTIPKVPVECWVCGVVTATSETVYLLREQEELPRQPMQAQKYRNIYWKPNFRFYDYHFRALDASGKPFRNRGLEHLNESLPGKKAKINGKEFEKKYYPTLYASELEAALKREQAAASATSTTSNTKNKVDKIKVDKKSKTKSKNTDSTATTKPTSAKEKVKEKVKEKPKPTPVTAPAKLAPAKISSSVAKKAAPPPLLLPPPPAAKKSASVVVAPILPLPPVTATKPATPVVPKKSAPKKSAPKKPSGAIATPKKSALKKPAPKKPVKQKKIQLIDDEAIEATSVSMEEEEKLADNADDDDDDGEDIDESNSGEFEDEATVEARIDNEDSDATITEKDLKADESDDDDDDEDDDSSTNKKKRARSPSAASEEEDSDTEEDIDDELEVEKVPKPIKKQKNNESSTTSTSSAATTQSTATAGASTPANKEHQRAQKCLPSDMPQPGKGVKCLPSDVPQPVRSTVFAMPSPSPSPSPLGLQLSMVPSASDCGQVAQQFQQSSPRFADSLSTFNWDTDMPDLQLNALLPDDVVDGDQMMDARCPELTDPPKSMSTEVPAYQAVLDVAVTKPIANLLMNGQDAVSRSLTKKITGDNFYRRLLESNPNVATENENNFYRAMYFGVVLAQGWRPMDPPTATTTTSTACSSAPTPAPGQQIITVSAATDLNTQH